GVVAVGDVAVEVFGDGDLGGESAPGLGHLDVLLLEDRLAGVVGDLSGALVPLDLVKRRNGFLTEDAGELQSLGGAPATGGGDRTAAAVFDGSGAGRGWASRFQLD